MKKLSMAACGAVASLPFPSAHDTTLNGHVSRHTDCKIVITDALLDHYNL